MTTQNTIQTAYEGLTLKEQKEIFLSSDGWEGETGESRQPCKDMKPSTMVAFQKNGKWVVEQFKSYKVFFKSDKISINQNSLTFFPLDGVKKGETNEDAMNRRREEILRDTSTTSTYTLYQNSFMKNVANYPVAGEYCHKSVYADNSVILEKLKKQITELSLELSKFEKNEDGEFAFLNSEEEDSHLQPFTEAIIATLEEIGIHKNTTINPTLMNKNIGLLAADLFYNFANNEERNKARDFLDKQLKKLIPILLSDSRKEVFEGLATFAGDNQLAAGFKEAIDKTKGELHTCYNLFVNEYGEEFTKMSSLEQEMFMRNKSIMYPGASTQAGGYPDILFVGKDNKLVYGAPTKKDMTMAASFEGNQIVRHPLDIFYNMKQCFDIANEDDISTFKWSESNINKFKEYSANPKNWNTVKKGEESSVGGEHLQTLESQQYKDFNIVSNQIFPFPTRSTVDKMFKDAGVEMTDDELGTFYTYVFAKVSGHVLAFDQSIDNDKLMSDLHVANINETKMKFHSMVERIGDKISSKLSSLFTNYKAKSEQGLEKSLTGPQNDLLVMAGMVIGRSSGELKMFTPAAGSDLSALIKGIFTKEETQRADLKETQMQRKNLLEITKLYNLHDNPAFFEGEGLRRRIMDGKEVLVINELFTSIKEDEKDKLIEELTDEEYGTPIFYQAYQAHQDAKAKEILQKMQAIYKPNTSKGDLLASLREKYNTDTVNQSVKLSDTEELAEYVISMKFAEDMEIKTVQQILESNPLSDVFSPEEAEIILSTIGERSKNKGNAKTGSHEPINFTHSK